jgi:hypothetical protein
LLYTFRGDEILKDDIVEDDDVESVHCAGVL